MTEKHWEALFREEGVKLENTKETESDGPGSW